MSRMPDVDRFSRPVLSVDGSGAQPRPMTTVEARENLVQAADRYRAEGSEKAAWAMEAACWQMLAATYELEGIL